MFVSEILKCCAEYIFLYITHKVGHKGKIWFTNTVNREEYFFSFYTLIIYLPIETVFLGKTVNDRNQKQVGIFV